MSADGSEARFRAFVDAEISCRHLEEAVAELHARHGFGELRGLRFGVQGFRVKGLGFRVRV